MCRVAIRSSLGREPRRSPQLSPILGDPLPTSVPNIARSRPKGFDRNAELKRSQQMWEAGEAHDDIGRILGQQHTGQQNSDGKKMQLQTEEQRGKRACALTARGSISKAMKVRLGGDAAGTAECELEQRVQHGEEAGTKKPVVLLERARVASVPQVKLAPMSASGPAGERQEHFDAVVALAGAGQRRRMFRVSQ